MSVSYILEKSELIYFLGNAAAENRLPQGYKDFADSKSLEDIKSCLIRKGYISDYEGMISTEATIAFLIEQLVLAKAYSETSNEKIRVYYCPKLIIILAEDRLAPAKCRLEPLQNEQILSEISAECNISILEKKSFDKKLLGGQNGCFAC